MGSRHICMDIGGTKVLGAIFDEKGKIIHRVKKKTNVEKGIEQIEEKIVKVIQDLLDESGMNISEIAAIGAGAPGVIDENKGVIVYAPNLPWRNYNIKANIEEIFKVPFYIGNDVNMGVLGEWKFGSGKERENLVGLFVGTGVGGGLILNNKLYTGSRHAAAELGHMVLNPEGPYCNCGQRGCLEAYSSKIAMTREIRAQFNRGRKSLLADLLDSEDVVFKSKDYKKAIEEKDELALEVLDRAIYYLAIAGGSLVNIFNPEAIILGGGVLEAMGDYIMPVFRKYIERFTWPYALENTELVQAELGDDSILYGALALIYQNNPKE